MAQEIVEELKLRMLVCDLLESGDDEGCNGLIVVGRDEYRDLQDYMHQSTRVRYGCDLDAEDED